MSNAKGFGQKYIKKRTNYQYMAMGHVIDLFWANAEKHSLDKGPMQNNIPLCWAHVETLDIYLSIFDKDVFNTFCTEM